MFFRYYYLDFTFEGSNERSFRIIKISIFSNLVEKINSLMLEIEKENNAICYLEKIYKI